MTKKCSKCKIEKDRKEFHKDSNQNSGYACKCITCKKEHYEDNKEKILEQQKKWRAENPEKVAKINKEWKENNKDKVNGYKKKYLNKNRKYFNIYNNIWRKNNPIDKDIISKRGQIYYVQNREEIKEKQNNYRKNNKEKTNKYQRERRKTDIVFRLNGNISSSIKQNLNDNKVAKNRRHWEDIVGYTKEKLKEHLEKLFTKDMSWDNYGEWEIDHIIPKIFFKYTCTDDIEFKYCWSLLNIQPLMKKDNRIKQDKITLWGKEIICR